MKRTRVLLLSTVAVSCLSFAVHAEDGGYSDEVNWDLNRTTQRSNMSNDAAGVGDMAAPGYNPNILRPAGDGFGRHEATQDIDMQNNAINSVSRINGDGTMVIDGLDYPTTPYAAANKSYVDEEIAKATEDLEEEINESGGENITAGDGLERNGDEISVDNTVVRTAGDQNIAGVKNFQTRINISSTSNRPFDSRSHADNGAGVYGRSTSANMGYGVVGISDGAGSVGVFGLTGADGARAGNFEATGDNATGVFGMTSGNGGRAGMFRAYDGAETSVSVIGWEEGDSLMTFGVSQAADGTFAPSAEITSVPGGVRFFGLADPVSGSDAANKSYVDNAITGVGNDATQDLAEVLTEGNSAGGQEIVGLAGPTSGSSAATKTYVDDAIAGLGGGTTQNISEVLNEGNDAGGQSIVGLPDPTVGSGAATKTYVDTAISGLSGPQDLIDVLGEGNSAGGSRIVGLGAPASDADAANKKYVDDAIASVGGGGGADNLGNHTATQNLDMSNRRIENIFAAQIVQGSGAGITLGNNLPWDDVNIAVIGTPGDPGTSHTTYIDDATLDSWRIRTHENGSTNFENALDLRFGSRELYVYGERMLKEGDVDLLDVLSEDNNAGGYRITGLSDPAIGSDAATKDYVDSQISGGGAGDNLGNHTATQTLDMDNRRIDNIFDARFVQGTGAGITIGNNLPYTEANMVVMGAPGAAGTTITTYIDDDTVDGWRLRMHDSASDFETGLDLRFGERSLYVYGDKVLTTQNLSDQQLDFNNDRDGSEVMSSGGFVLNNFTSAIGSTASGKISTSMTFSATGETSTGILGFASGMNSAGIRGVSNGPGATGAIFSAQGNDGSPYGDIQTAIRATLRSDVASGSKGIEVTSSAQDATLLRLNTGTSNAKIASFSIGGNEALSIVPHGITARMLGYNSAGEQTVDMNTHEGKLALTGNSAGGLKVTQPSSTPKIDLTRTGSTFGNSHIRYAVTDGATTTEIFAGMGTAGRFTVGTGRDLSYGTDGAFEVYADTGDLRWKGTATGTVSTPSDARLKENVSDIVNALEKLSQLRPVEYDLKEDGAHNYGVIAQELEMIYPEMVNVNDEGILSVEYQQLISPMLAALLEMDARITALENQ